MLIASPRDQDIAIAVLLCLLEEAEKFAWTVSLVASAILAYHMRRQVESYRIKQTVFASFLQLGYFGWSFPGSWSS